MYPRRVGGKLAQEGCCAGRVGPAAIVFEVGDEALDLLLVIVADGHAPSGSARTRRRREHTRGPRVVVAEETRAVIAERDDDRAGERGEIDDASCAKLSRVGDAVNEDEAAFGVCVYDFDGVTGEQIGRAH